VTSEQARACGLSENAIKHRRVTGRWNRVRRGVFAIAGGPGTWEQAAMAAVLASGEGAVASHTTAAAVWDLPNVVPEVIEMTTDRRGAGSLSRHWPEPSWMGLAPHSMATGPARNDLVVAGWRVLRFTSAFTDGRVVETVATALVGLAQKPGA